MDAVVYLEAHQAMCDENPTCSDCPLRKPADMCDMDCTAFVKRYPHKAVNMVAKWIDDHGGVALTDTPDQPTSSVAVGRGDILDKAKACVCRDRNREYGEPEDGFKLIAALWEPVIRANCVAPGVDVSVGPETVALFMALLKIARAAQNPGHLDSWVDMAGYAACGGEIACKEEK